MNVLRKIRLKFWNILAHYRHRYSLNYAHVLGVKISDNVRFTGCPDFGTEPWLIEIGDNCLITQNVRFMTHDGSVNIVRRLDEKYKDIVKFGRIVVADNVFIGANTIIMPNVHIGSYAIIAACSCVTKSVPDGEVWGGIPAKKIATLEEYADKLLDISQYYLKNDALLTKSKQEISTIVSDVYWRYNHR